MDDLAWHLERIANSVSQEGQVDWIEWREQHAVSQAEQHRELIETLTHYQSKMTEANRSALEEAISHVMREFNTRIEEQYGDNFKKLNEAVGQMMLWQSGHKGQLEDLMAANERSAKSTTIAAEAFEKLITQTQSFTSVASDMETLLNALQSQSQNLREYLTTFTSMIVDAQQGLPQLESRIMMLTTGLHEVVEAQSGQMKTLLEQTAGGIRDTSERVSQLLIEGTERSQKAMGVQLTSLLEQNNLQLATLEKGMEDELKKALTTFGYQLTALSEKFVNDYVPLTDRLQELLTAVKIKK